MFTVAETIAAAAMSFLATAIAAAYALDGVGFGLHPFVVLAVAVAGVIAVVRATAPPTWSDLVPLVAIIVGVFAALLWIARPQLLPPGSGSDLTHHLLLIDYIERTGHLVHDPALSAYLGEMIDYTAGLHLLAVFAGAWFRTDGLHAVYPVVAFTVALKLGFVFLIARRFGLSRALSLTAVLLLFLPRDYFLGSFAHSSYLAQVASEMFAVAMWWAVVVYTDEPGIRPAALFGLAGAAAYLTWPVWIGPLVLLFVVTFISHFLLVQRRGALVAHAAIAFAPIAVAALAHAAGRSGAAVIAGTGGFALYPTPSTVGWPFLVLSTAGLLVAVRDPRTRSAPLLLLAIAAQAAALFLVARARGANSPYMTLKMFYLAIYPLAIAAAIGIEQLVTLVARPFQGRVGAPETGALRVSGVLASIIVAVLAVRSVGAMPRPHPVVSDALRDAGRWARAHVDPACVDYLTADEHTAYWLHLVVLGNPRESSRTMDPDTFEPEKAIVRWVLPGGLPHAIAEHVDGLPKDIRGNVDVLARFGGDAVIKRRGASTCSSKP